MADDFKLDETGINLSETDTRDEEPIRIIPASRPAKSRPKPHPARKAKRARVKKAA